ncbi:MAG: hypothetical protein ACC656_01220 [Candidatus Heimdallarchaeota archaeon]
MESVIHSGIKLIKEAIDDRSDIPIQTVIDILITANNTIGYGSKYEEAELLLIVYSIALKNDSPSAIPKIHHFSCLIYGVIFSLLSVDESTSDHKVPSMMKVMKVNANATRIYLIRTLLHKSYPLLDNISPSYWVMELISFILTAICLIQDFDVLSEVDISIERSITKIHKKYRDNIVIEKWKNRWIEASDYHRFSSSLIFAEHAKEEDAWLNRARGLFP